MITPMRMMLVAGALLATSASLEAESQDLCESVKAAIAAAPGQFASLKGASDPYEPTFYTTSWRIPGTTDDDCFVTNDEDSGHDISCRVDASSFEAARAQAAQWATDVERCLAASGKFLARDWRESNASTRLTSGHYTAKSFFVPTDRPAYDVEVRVAANCTVSRRRGERCTSSLTVELTGDER